MKTLVHVVLEEAERMSGEELAQIGITLVALPLALPPGHDSEEVGVLPPYLQRLFALYLKEEQNLRVLHTEKAAKVKVLALQGKAEESEALAREADAELAPLFLKVDLLKVCAWASIRAEFDLEDVEHIGVMPGWKLIKVESTCNCPICRLSDLGLSGGQVLKAGSRPASPDPCGPRARSPGRSGARTG